MHRCRRSSGAGASQLRNRARSASKHLKQTLETPFVRNSTGNYSNHRIDEDLRSAIGHEHHMRPNDGRRGISIATYNFLYCYVCSWLLSATRIELLRNCLWENINLLSARSIVLFLMYVTLFIKTRSRIMSIYKRNVFLFLQ